MSSIDDRIVNMHFNNTQFQKGISQTNESLSDLKNNLKLDGVTKGMGEVQAAANRFSLAGMAEAVENISSKFSILGAVGFTLIQNITNSAIQMGQRIAGSLIDPIIQGGAKRALALQQAQFQFRGLGLNIQDTMNAALAAVKGTAFGLDDAATAAAQFGASGITATNGLESVLRSVAGVAAQTGSSYANVANIFETVAGNGRLMGMQLTQLSSYGVNAAAILAKSFHTTESKVRDMVSNGKVSFKQFSDAMNAAFGANAAKANETYTGALSNMHAALARIGADVASPYFLGMRDVFNALGPMFDNVHTAVQPLINDFASFQADSAKNTVNIIDKILGPGVIKSIGNVVTAIRTIGHALEQGFHSIFPDNTEKQLTAVSTLLQKVTAAFIPDTKAADELRRTFAGLFALFDIFGQIIGSVIKAFAQLFGYTTQGAGGILTFSAKVGDLIVKIDQAIKHGQVFQTFFKGLAGVIAVPIGILKTFVGVIYDFVTAITHINTGGFDDFADDVSKRFAGLNQLAQFFTKLWHGVETIAKAVWNFMVPIFVLIGQGISFAAAKVKEAFSALSFDQGVQILNTGIFAAFVLVLRGFFGNLGGILRGNGVAFVSQFKSIVSQIRTNLKALEMNTNAKTLKEIAVSIALLAASAVALSLVNPERLGIAMGAITTSMGSLLASFATLGKIGSSGLGLGVKQSIVMIAMMNGLAGAMLVMAGAIAILGAIPLANIIQGVSAFEVVLGSLVSAIALFRKDQTGTVAAAGALVLIANALLILSGAIAILGALPFANIVQGVSAIIVVLGALVGALALMKKIGPTIVITGASIALFAPALLTLSGAIALLGALPMARLVQGMTAFASTLGVMVGALALLNLLGPRVLLSAVAIGVIAVAMGGLVASVALLGKLKMATVIQGVVALATVLALVAGAALLLGLVAPQALAGAGAMIGIALAIGILAPAIKLLGSMSWDDIGRSIAVLAAAIAVLAVGGILLIPAAVGFMLLGGAIFLIGQGVFAAATGLTMLVGAITAITAVGVGAVTVLVLAVKAFIDQLPALGAGIGAAIVSMAVVIGQNAPQLIQAFVALLLAMLTAIDQVIPAAIITATLLISAFIRAMVVLVPQAADAGLAIIEGVLGGIAKHIGDITEQAVDIITNFITALGNNMYKIITAAGDLVLKFITGIGDYVKTHSGQFVKAGSQLFRAIVDGIAAAIRQGGKDIAYAGEKIGWALIQGAKNALHINSPSKVFRDDIMPSVFEGIEDGNDRNLDRAAGAGEDIGNTMADSAIQSVKKSIAGISSVIDDNIDSSPTIRPIFDLTDIQSGAQKISSLMPKPSISLDMSDNVATSISLQEQAKNAQLIIDATKSANQPSKVVNFTQNNNSPKALTTTEIYRNTKNQLSTLKEDLDVVDQSGSTKR